MTFLMLPFKPSDCYSKSGNNIGQYLIAAKCSLAALLWRFPSETRIHFTSRGKPGLSGKCCANAASLSQVLISLMLLEKGNTFSVFKPLQRRKLGKIHRLKRVYLLGFVISLSFHFNYTHTRIRLASSRANLHSCSETILC